MGTGCCKKGPREERKRDGDKKEEIFNWGKRGTRGKPRIIPIISREKEVMGAAMTSLMGRDKTEKKL